MAGDRSVGQAGVMLERAIRSPRHAADGSGWPSRDDPSVRKRHANKYMREPLRSRDSNGGSRT
jgi:hypothetical protein